MVSMCTRWHSKGYCVGDCQNKDSHVGKSKIPSEKVDEHKEYLKKL